MANFTVRQFRLLFVASVLLTPVACMGSANIVLVDNGKTNAVIVTADEPAKSAQEAALALQRVVREMTGVELPIHTEGQYDGDGAPIAVGMSRLAGKLGADVAQDRDAGDHYVIRADGHGLALVGNDEGTFRGSAYAVYDLLQRLGCGWFGPDPVWHVIPKRKKLVVPSLMIDERPAFEMRRIQLVTDRTMQDAWRLGGRRVEASHVLGRHVPRKKYLKEHPDYFGKEQPCLTHPDVVEIVVERFRKEIDRQKGVVSFSLSAEDTGGFCECDRCKAIGNISARMLNFANSVARELAKTHPKRYLLTFYAYWYSHDAPKPTLKAEPGVCTMMVNQGNHVRPLDEPESKEVAQSDGPNNTSEINAFSKWAQTGAIMGIYEWWIPGYQSEAWKSAPWYSGETALRNLRYWKQGGVRYIYYESYYEADNGFPVRWPLCYVGARGLWDPTLTAEQIMAEACGKLYGPAAEPMQQFYRIIEKAMADCDLRTGNWNLPSPEKVYSPEVVTAATAYLDAAAAATADPAELARITQERQMWDRAKEVMAKLRKGEASQK